MGATNAERIEGNARFRPHDLWAVPDTMGATDPDPQEFLTLPDVLRARAEADPHSLALGFLDHDEAFSAELSWSVLNMRASRIASGLLARGLAGQRILLQHPQGPDFAVAFFGVLAAGAVAVPAPHNQSRRGAAQRILAIVEDAAPGLVLTTPEQEPALKQTLAGRVEVLTEQRLIDDAQISMPSALASSTVLPGDLAFLQYTSGSTGTPKGVMISHAAIMANQRLIVSRFGHSRSTVMVSWLPMFHDMGLIGSLLQPIYAGFPCIMMAPDAFLEDPARWLRAIGRHRGTTAGAPNFAYDYCVDRIPAAERAGLDLRSWRVAFNGSEPVRARTLSRFAEAFGPYGFRASAAYPCYGMAEATLLISGGEPGTLAKTVTRPTVEGAARVMVSNGATAEGHEIAIVDPASLRQVDEACEGEVWVRGPSLAMGYWQKPEASAQTFDVILEGRGSGWMRTGDLGFLQSGELFISGRLKDVIILKGRNHYPQDIEATAMAAHPALRPEGGAAFLVEGAERSSLVLVHEVTSEAFRAPPLAEIAGALRSAISAHHGLHLSVVALIAPGSLPKTTSGKVQRSRTRITYLDGTLPILGEDRHGPPLRSATDPKKA